MCTGTKKQVLGWNSSPAVTRGEPRSPAPRRIWGSIFSLPLGDSGQGAYPFRASPSQLGHEGSAACLLAPRKDRREHRGKQLVILRSPTSVLCRAQRLHSLLLCQSRPRPVLVSESGLSSFSSWSLAVVPTSCVGPAVPDLSSEVLSLTPQSCSISSPSAGWGVAEWAGLSPAAGLDAHTHLQPGLCPRCHCPLDTIECHCRASLCNWVGSSYSVIFTVTILSVC